MQRYTFDEIGRVTYRTDEAEVIGGRTFYRIQDYEGEDAFDSDVWVRYEDAQAALDELRQRAEEAEADNQNLELLRQKGEIAALREALKQFTQEPIDDGAGYCTACGWRNGQYYKGREIAGILSAGILSDTAAAAEAHTAAIRRAALEEAVKIIQDIEADIRQHNAWSMSDLPRAAKAVRQLAEKED